MKGQPVLQPVPHFLKMLTIKADLNGVTILKEGRYRKRYTGSKQYAVDINGVLRTSGELKLLLQEGMEKGPKFLQKKSPRANRGKINTEQPTPKDTPTTYTINKPEIRQRLYAMIASQPEQKRQLYFWTITFPVKTDDAVIHRLFNIWLTRLRKEKLLRDYLWVAERQQNGTLHFHLAIPHKLPVKKANAYMRSALVNCARSGEINYNVYAAKRYNGVDIAKNRKNRIVTNFAVGKRGARALTTYITKYITKNDGTFTHLAWHNSRGFSKLFTGVTFTVHEFVSVCDLRKFVRSQSVISNEYFQWHPWINGPPVALSNELFKLNSFIQHLN